MIADLLQNAADRLLQAPLTPMDRIDSVRRGLADPHVSAVWWLLAAGAGVIVLAFAAYLLLAGRRRRRQARLTYQTSPGGVRPGPVRPKLRSAVTPRVAASNGLDSRGIPSDVEVTVVEPSGRTLRGWVETPSTESLNLRTLSGAAEVRPGQTVHIRYAHRQSLWEFEAEVLHVRLHMISVRHTNQIELVDRRRFRRVPTRRPALLAVLPFRAGGAPLAPPRFEESELVEIAGMGLVLRTPLQTEVGDKVLAILHFPDDLRVQGVARVSRVDAGADGRYTVAIELLHLDPDELAEMTLQTNHAARIEDARVAAAEAAAQAAAT